MPPPKLTADQLRRIEEIEEFQRAADHLKHLVTELEGNRAGQTRTIQQLSEKIANAASQMRQRALTANVGTIADLAGTMSVMAGRGGGINMKIRALAEAVNSIYMQLDAAMKHATTPTNAIRECVPAPKRAEVELRGMRWRGGAAPTDLRERLGIQLQDTQLADKLTVEETVRLFRSFYRAAHSVEEVLGLVGLEEKRTAWVGKLSGGQKQRLAVACALVSRPDLLFLDEPTTGLDPQSRRQLWDVIGRFRAAGGTVLLTTHYMDEDERLCNRVAIMDHGQVIALGTPRELILSLGAEHVVEFALADGAARAPAPAELAALPGVKSVRHGADRTALTVTEVHRAVPALLGLLEGRGAELSLLATHHATLEDVFVALTGRQLRDA